MKNEYEKNQEKLDSDQPKENEGNDFLDQILKALIGIYWLLGNSKVRIFYESMALKRSYIQVGCFGDSTSTSTISAYKIYIPFPLTEGLGSRCSNDCVELDFPDPTFITYWKLPFIGNPDRIFGRSACS